MMIDNRYKIEPCVIELLDDKGTLANTGDVYDSFKEFRKKHPDSSYKFGFMVIDTTTGFMPDDSEDWFESIEEAMNYWETDLKGYDKPSRPITTTFF